MGVGHRHNIPTPFTIVLKSQLEEAMARKWTKQPYEEGINCNNDSIVKYILIFLTRP
jgi:hypothetical protein